MIEFKPEIEEIKTSIELVVINGEEVGAIWRTSYGYQCQLKTEKMPFWMSLNGTGKTKTICLKKTLQDGVLEGKIMERESLRILGLLD